jgi:hypothetical protein
MMIWLALLAIPSHGTVSADITVTPQWTVTAELHHDDRYLYIHFRHLKHDGQERYPEILVDPSLLGGDSWRPGQWWLHSSYNLCEGNGAYNVYEINGVFQCAKTKPGFEANHFPLTGDGVMDVKIALDKLGVVTGRPFGFALDATDTHDAWAFWPDGAVLARPQTWGQAVLVTSANPAGERARTPASG